MKIKQFIKQVREYLDMVEERSKKSKSYPKEVCRFDWIEMNNNMSNMTLAFKDVREKGEQK